MRVALSVVAVAALAVVAFAGGAMWWDIDAARMASEIEIKIHSNGTIEDVEYHVPVDTVPPAVKRAMVEDPGGLYPGATLVAAEKEYEGGTLFYELAVLVGEGEDAKKHEVMFTPEGEVHSKEIQISWEDDTYGDLAPIRDDLHARYGVAESVCEVILDAQDQLVEFHVKLTTGGGDDAKKHKLIVTKDGFLAGAYLEVVSELEVPIPPR